MPKLLFRNSSGTDSSDNDSVFPYVAAPAPPAAKTAVAATALALPATTAADPVVAAANFIFIHFVCPHPSI